MDTTLSQAPGGSEAGPSFRVDIRSSIEADLPLAEWRALAERAIEHNLFAEPDFVLSGLRHLPEGKEAKLVFIWRETPVERILRGVFLLSRQPSPFSVLFRKFWKPPLAALGVPLIDGEEPGAVVSAFLDAVEGAGILFPLVPLEGAFMAALQAAGRPIARFDEHSRVVLPAGEGTADRIRSKTLREMRRQRKRLEEIGVVAVESLAKAKPFQDAVETFLALEASGWKGKRRSALKMQAGGLNFMRTFSRDLARQGYCRVDVLRVDGRAIAAAIVIRNSRRAWFWKIAYDESFARFSPGVQLAFEVTKRQALEDAIDLTDSCAVENHTMMEQLWSDRMVVADIAIGSPGRSFAIGCFGERVRRGLRAKVKAVYKRVGRR